MDQYEFHPVNPNLRDIKQVAEKLNTGAIAIFPTDTLYAMGCIMTNKVGIEKICRILEKKEKHTKMSLICPSISEVSKYTMQIDNSVFKVMKRYLPGPYTFVLKSNNNVQKYFKNSKEEIGIRIPDQKTLSALFEFLHAPLISTSLNKDGEHTADFNDPEIIYDTFQHQVDILINGGIGNLGESTVIDCTGNEMIVIRQGIGPVD